VCTHDGAAYFLCGIPMYVGSDCIIVLPLVFESVVGCPCGPRPWTDNRRNVWALRGSRGSHGGAVRSGPAKIRAEMVENGTITRPLLCSLCFGSICWLPALLHLALVVHVVFFVLVFVAFLVAFLVFELVFVVPFFVGHSVVPGWWERAAIGGVPPVRVQTTAGWHCLLLLLHVPSLQRSTIPVFAGVIWNRLPCDRETGNNPVPGDLGLLFATH
jgi:hypothetical protein